MYFILILSLRRADSAMNIPKKVSKLLENQDSSYAYKLLLEYLQGALAFCWDLESITSYILPVSCQWIPIQGKDKAQNNNNNKKSNSWPWLPINSVEWNIVLKYTLKHRHTHTMSKDPIFTSHSPKQIKLYPFLTLPCFQKKFNVLLLCAAWWRWVGKCTHVEVTG